MADESLPPDPAPARPERARARLASLFRPFRTARLWFSAAALLAAILIAVTALAWVTASDRDQALGELRASLAQEEAAHQAGDARASALAACVAAMKADEAELLGLNDEMISLDRRVSGSGDWEVARLAYQTGLEKAVSDFYASWIDTVRGDQVAFKRDYANAQMGWDRLRDLKDRFQSLSGSIASDRSEAAQAYAALEARLAATETTCRRALDLGASPSPSLAPSAS